MLQVHNLVKFYRSTPAVNGVSFEVRPGEIVGLLGPNGAGKTTAMRCIAGILLPSSGQILINGYDLSHDQKNAKSGLAYVPEVPSLYELLTVEEHLRFIAMCFERMDGFESRSESLLKKYDLIEKRNAFVATLSKGMRQKLAVACAMIHDASVLLLDEPLIGIDPRGAHEFKQELTRARDEGAAILISTHLLDTAERFCDRVIIMAKGRHLVEGTIDELRKKADMQHATLEQIFLKITDIESDEAVPFDLT